MWSIHWFYNLQHLCYFEQSVFTESCICVPLQLHRFSSYATDSIQRYSYKNVHLSDQKLLFLFQVVGAPFIHPRALCARHPRKTREYRSRLSAIIRNRCRMCGSRRYPDANDKVKTAVSEEHHQLHLFRLYCSLHRRWFKFQRIAGRIDRSVLGGHNFSNV